MYGPCHPPPEKALKGTYIRRIERVNSAVIVDVFDALFFRKNPALPIGAPVTHTPRDDLRDLQT